jgi:hypothetical protein
MEKVQRRTRDELYESFGHKVSNKDTVDIGKVPDTNISYGMSAMDIATEYEEEFLG